MPAISCVWAVIVALVVIVVMAFWPLRRPRFAIGAKWHSRPAVNLLVVSFLPCRFVGHGYNFLGDQLTRALGKVYLPSAIICAKMSPGGDDRGELPRVQSPKSSAGSEKLLGERSSALRSSFPAHTPSTSRCTLSPPLPRAPCPSGPLQRS